MDEYIRNSIDTRRKTIDDYYNIPEEAAGEVSDLFAEMEQLGEASSDVMDFEQRFAASDLNSRYMNLFAKLTVKSSAVGGAMADSAKGIFGNKENRRDFIKEELEHVAHDAEMKLRRKMYMEKEEELRKIPGYMEARNAAGWIGWLRDKKKDRDEE